MNDYTDLAKRAYGTLTTRWFTPETPSWWVPDDYWKTPTIIRELIRYAVLTGDPGKTGTGVRKSLDNAFAAGEGYLTSSQFLDDLAAWGRMFAAAGDWLASTDPTAAAKYREQAEEVFAQLDGSWDDVCKGGIWWKRDPHDPQNFKASVSTMQYADIGGALGKAVARAWEWEVSAGLVDEHHIVWGGLTSDCVRDPANKPFAADQGHSLGALWGLYATTHDTRWLQTGCDVAAGTIATMSWPGTQVLATAVDGQWRSADEDFRQTNINATLSKGLFVENLGDFAASLAALGGEWAGAAAQQAVFLRANADSLAAQYPQGVYDMDWLHGDASYNGDSDDTLSACLQYSALSALVAAAKNPG